MAIRFHPLHSFGAEVTGVDLNTQLSRDQLDAIAAGWRQHAVLVFRDQNMTDEDQQRFTESFGPVQSARGGLFEKRGALFIGNLSVDGIPADIPYGAMQFHQDGAYAERPTKATMLYAIEVPEQGGDTLFASQEGAYRRLPPPLREQIDGLRIEFDFDYAAVQRDQFAKIDGTFIHPLVIAHPETGRPLLFCNRLMAKRIVGLEAAESDALIGTLCDAQEASDNVYRHAWRAGDFVAWDNLATAHGRTDFDRSARRLLRRTTILGDRPRAYRPHAVTRTHAGDGPVERASR